MACLCEESVQWRRSFRWLWASTTCINLSDGIGLVALPLLATTITQEPLLISGLVVAQRLPWLLISPLSGALADRFERRFLLQIAMFTRGLLFVSLLVLVYQSWLTLPLFYLLAFSLGAAETLADITAVAMLPDFVPSNHLTQANSKLWTTQTVMQEFIGPPLGGMLNALGSFVPLALIGILYTTSATLLLPFRNISSRTTLLEVQKHTIWQDIATGMRWFWSNHLIHGLAIKGALENAAWATMSSVLILLVQKHLQLPPEALGFLLAAAAIGGVTGAAAAPYLQLRLGIGSIIILNLLLQTMAYIGIVLTTMGWFAAAMLAAISFTGSAGNIVEISLRQRIIPQEMQGRATSCIRLYLLGAMPLGAFLGGITAEVFGLTAVCWVSAGILLLATLCFQPQFRAVAQASKDAGL